MSFKDIFKKSFLEGFASTEITTLTVVTALAWRACWHYTSFSSIGS